MLISELLDCCGLWQRVQWLEQTLTFFFTLVAIVIDDSRIAIVISDSRVASDTSDSLKRVIFLNKFLTALFFLKEFENGLKNKKKNSINFTITRLRKATKGSMTFLK